MECRNERTGVVIVVATIAIFLASSFSHLPCLADSAPEVIRFNNEGVRDLNSNCWQPAAEKFTAALKIEPSYRIARENLAITYNNWGLSLKAKPNEALPLLHKSLILSPDNITTGDTINNLITSMGKNSKLADDRVDLAGKSMAQKDYCSAAAEYFEALRLRPDSQDILSKLEEAYGRLEPPFKSTSIEKLIKKGNLPVNETDAESRDANAHLSASPHDTSVDYEPYLQRLERHIRRYWYPSRHDWTSVPVVEFRIGKSGEISNAHLVKTGDIAISNQAALKAVENAGPVEPLPGTDTALDIQFWFSLSNQPGKRTHAEIKGVPRSVETSEPKITLPPTTGR